MLIRFFRHIRRQPKKVRNNYALGIAMTFTGIVALVWIVNTLNQGIVPEGELATNKESIPFSNLFKQTKEQFANLKEAEKSEDQNAETATSTPTEANTFDLTLSQENIDALKQGQGTSSATTTNNYGFGTSSTSSRPIYQEVRIATTSSQSATPTSQTNPNN